MGDGRLLRGGQRARGRPRGRPPVRPIPPRLAPGNRVETCDGGRLGLVARTATHLLDQVRTLRDSFACSRFAGEGKLASLALNWKALGSRHDPARRGSLACETQESVRSSGTWLLERRALQPRNVFGC